MLNSEKIFINVANARDNSLDKIGSFVRFTIRNFEYNKIANDKSYKECINIIEESHQGIKYLDIEDPEIRDILSKSTSPKKSNLEIETFISKRFELKEIKDDLDSLPVKNDDFVALSITDKCFIELQANACYSSILLEESLFKDVDLSKAIYSFYHQGKIKDIKDSLRLNFSKVVSKNDGSLFYGIKLKKSDFSDFDIRNFLADFGGRAKRTTIKNKDGSTTTTSYEWSTNETDKKAQLKAITKLFAVIFDRNKDYEIIKDSDSTKDSTIESDNK